MPKRISDTTKIVIGGVGALLGFLSLTNVFKKDKDKAAAGETWNYTYAVYPDITSKAEFDEMSSAIEYVSTGRVIDVDTLKNTLIVTVRYSRAPESQPYIGQEAKIGKYNLILTEMNKVA